MSIVTPGQSATLTDAQVPARAPVTGARRTQILAWLREADGPRTAAEVAEHTELHLNTARFHLDALVEAGHAVRRREERSTPGRPRVLYSAERGNQSVRSYRLLAGMLTGLVRALGGDDAAAHEAGRSWGRHLLAGDPPTGRPDEQQALARLDDLMDRIGFMPETRPGDTPEVHLHHCPFIEVVEGNQDVVCALHRGLVQGALEESGAPLEVASLQPFATPRTCVARLTRNPSSA